MLRKSNLCLPYFWRQLTIATRSYAKQKGQTKAMLKDARRPEESGLHMDQPPNATFIMRIVGSSNLRRWLSVLEKHPQLKAVKRKDMANAAEALKTLGYDVEDILTKPMILYHNAMTLEHHHSVLRECGFEHITIALLSKFVTVLNKSVTLLKSHGYLPFTLDMVERLRTRFTDIDVQLELSHGCNEQMELKTMRQRILNCYLRQRLAMSPADIEKLWKVYARIRHKSFASVQAMVQLLSDDLNFSHERIIKNSFLLHGDADNVRRIMQEIPTIAGNDIRSIVFKRPKIIMSSCDALLKTLEHVRAYGITEEAVMRCMEVLTLGPDTVLERLRDVNEIEEFKVLFSNPRILRLVHYQNKARLRLEYLNQLKVRCASLHILSCDSMAFAKFARDGSDRTKGRDIVVFLGNVLGRDENEIRALLSRHPNWCHIPVIHVKQCYDFLISKLFSHDDIFANIHLLLYPTKRIDEKLCQLQSREFLADLCEHIDTQRLSNCEILTITLYLIESEFHFTGDGIWTEQHAQQVENFHNLLPDFPESLNKGVYKYGVKPSNADTQTALQA